MAQTLHFSLVSPERELFNGYVDQVDAPGSEGDFGVLAGHAPFMTLLRQGRIHVHIGDDEQVYEINGGFADVTPEGLIILVEDQPMTLADGVLTSSGAGGPGGAPTTPEPRI